MPRLTYAVHLDGALVTRAMLDEDPELAELLADQPVARLDESAEYLSGNAALAIAGRIKHARPDDLVTVVIW